MRPHALTQPPRTTWFGGLARVTAAVLSAGAALVSILSYTGASTDRREVAGERAHRLSLTPVADTAWSIGDTVQLAALATDDRGAALVGAAPAWSSADPAVAEVDQSGAVVARAPGSTVIIARVGSHEARSRILVDPRPASLRVPDPLLRVAEGERAPASVEVLDARGHPITGREVRWQTADETVARVDSAGQAEAVSPGRAVLTATLDALRADLAVEVVPVPASITVLGGEGQRAPAGTSLPSPVTAQVVSRTGRPIPGAVVSFQVRDGDGMASPAVDTADTRGNVATTWTLGGVPGRRQLAIAVEGVTVAPVVTAEADPVAGNTRVAVVAVPATGVAGDSLADALAIRVTDSVGIALADLPIAWSTGDGGRVSALSARTDSIGEARAAWRLGPRAGVQRVRVQVGNARTLPPFTIDARASAGLADTVIVRAGDRQAGRVGERLAKTVVVFVADRLGNPVPGAGVTAMPSAGTLEDSVVTTDSTGRARLAWTLGRTAGPQRLRVALARGKAAAEVSARARAGPPSVAAFVQAPATAAAGRPLRSGIAIEVRDAYGNPVPGERVTLASTSGAVSPARAVTDEAGRVTAGWTPGSKVGTATLTAKVGAGDLRTTRTASVTASRTTRRAP